MWQFEGGTDLNDDFKSGYNFGLNLIKIGVTNTMPN